MENRKVYYDKNYNRFFGVIKKYPRSYLITSLHGYYGTAKSGDTMRYSIPKSYLKNCVLVENPANEYTELDNGINGINCYKIIGYDCLHNEPKLDNKIFKWNKFAHKIAQYQWDKKNNFWKDLPDYNDNRDYDELDAEFDEHALS